MEVKDAFYIGLTLIAMLICYYTGHSVADAKHKFQRKRKDRNEVTPKSYWNYRVATRMRDGLNGSRWREFLIISCYYADGIANGYVENNPLNGFEEYDELNDANELIIKAFEKPTIDLDSFPSEYKF